jgi:hypothetical protein
LAFDAIIIPGGGVTPEGELPVWVQRRFDHAIELQPGGPFIALSGGSYHLPSPRNADGRPVFESYAGARYLLDRGVPAASIFTEISSYETIGNAFFARVQHTDVRGWRKLAVVNNAFHMPRTRAIFECVFTLGPTQSYDLTFETVENDGMPEDVLASRWAREQASLQKFLGLATRFQSLSDLHAWLYRENDAYQVEQATKVRPIDPALARLY